MSRRPGRPRLPRRALLTGGLAVCLLGGGAVLLGPGAVLARFAGTDLATFALGPVCVVVAVACWAESQRRLLVAAGAELSPRQGVLGYGAGTFAKQVLPAGHALGPGLVAYAFRSLTGRSYTETFAAVTLAELCNLVASGLLAAAGLLLLVDGEPSPALATARSALLVVGGSVGVLVGVTWYRRQTLAAAVHGAAWLVRGTVGRASRRVRETVAPPVVEGTIRGFYATFGAVADQRRAAAVAFGFTLLGWLAFVAPLYTSFRAIGVTLPLGVVLLVVPAAGLANAVPLPGGLGGAELAVGGTLVVLAGLDVTTAAAGVLLYRLCAFWFLAALGGLCAATLRVRVGDLAAGADDAEDGSGPGWTGR
jgi:hypothetical protein